MKNTPPSLRRFAFFVAFGVSFCLARAQTAQPPLLAPDTETIYCVSHVKPGQEAAYAALCAQTWAVYRRLDLVLAKPHILVQGVDASGKPYFVEIFTWKDAKIPDHAPAEVREVWRKLESACEPRGGRPGIDFSDGGVSVLAID